MTIFIIVQIVQIREVENISFLRSTVSGWSLFFMKLFAPDLHLINEWTFKGITREIDTGMSLNKNEEGISSPFGEMAWRFVNPSGEHFTVLVRAKDEQLTTLAEYQL